MFSGTISGWTYLIRSILQTFLIALVIGLYLLPVTGYKRASALTEKKWLRVTAAVSTLLLNCNSLMTAGECDAAFMVNNMPIFYWGVIFVCGILHLWLLFSNSKIQKHNG